MYGRIAAWFVPQCFPLPEFLLGRSPTHHSGVSYTVCRCATVATSRSDVPVTASNVVPVIGEKLLNTSVNEVIAVFAIFVFRCYLNVHRCFHVFILVGPTPSRQTPDDLQQAPLACCTGILLRYSAAAFLSLFIILRWLHSCSDSRSSSSMYSPSPR